MSLSRNALFGSFQVVATGGILFATYYYVVRTLGPEGIGLWSLVLAGASTSRLADFGFGAGVTKYVAHDMGAGLLAQAKGALIVGFVCSVCFTGLFVLGLYFLSEYFLALALRDIVTREAALAIVPVALASVWTAGSAAVLLNALDGIQRLDLRVGVVVVSSIVQLIGTWALVPHYGVRGLALAHFVQSATTLVMAALILRSTLGSFGRRTCAVELARFKDLLRYGAGVQAAAVAQMTIDPVARMLLARFGSLELTGFYEMSARLVVQVRSLLVAGYQAIIPYVAAIASSKKDVEVRDIYLQSYDLLVIVGIPYFGILIAALPAISYLWIGTLEPSFMLLGLIAVVGWAANALIVPAYYVFLGTGRLQWNVASQVVTATANAIIGLMLGLAFGGVGVAIGCCLALVLGSAVVLVGFHREQSISGRRALQPIKPVSLAAALAGLGIFFAAQLSPWRLPGMLIAFAGPMLLAVLVAVALVAWEPRLQRVLTRLSWSVAR